MDAFALTQIIVGGVLAGYFIPGVRKVVWALVGLAFVQIAVAAVLADWVHSYTGSDFAALLTLDPAPDRSGLLRFIIGAYVCLLAAAIVWIKTCAVGPRARDDI